MQEKKKLELSDTHDIQPIAEDTYIDSENEIELSFKTGIFVLGFIVGLIFSSASYSIYNKYIQPSTANVCNINTDSTIMQ